MNYCADIDCELEGLHCETGLAFGKPRWFHRRLEAADRASLFKTLTKGYFQRREMLRRSWLSGR